METKTFSQFGTTSVILVVGIFLFVIAFLLSQHPLNELHNYSITPIFMVSLGVIFFLYKLNITVSSEYVEHSFSIGLWKCKYKISNIKSAKPVTNSWFSGYGIRWISINGFLYNVSGNKAVELEFYDRKGVVRIGTDKPEEVATLINSRIASNPSADEIEYVQTQNWTKPLGIFGVIFAIGFVAIISYPEFIDTQTQLGNEILIIDGMEGFDIPYSSIKTLDTLISLPKVSFRSDGYGGFRTLLGSFVMADGTDVKLFIRKGSVPYIKIATKDEMVVYLNYRDSQKTRKLYQELKNKLQTY